MALVGQPGFSTDTESGLMSNLCWLMLNFLVCLEAECGMLTFWAFFGDLVLILKPILPISPSFPHPVFTLSVLGLVNTDFGTDLDLCLSWRSLSTLIKPVF